MGKFTFTKAEKLTKEIWIKELFKKGSSFNLYPFRIIYLTHPDLSIGHHQTLISVSVRNFKKAVDRNLLKRRIRESWRINKASLPTANKLLIAYIYTARVIEPSEKINASMLKAIETLAVRKK